MRNEPGMALGCNLLEFTEFDLTRAFSFDTATQSDGLHIMGLPLK